MNRLRTAALLLLLVPGIARAEDRSGTISLGITPPYAFAVLGDGGEVKPDGGGGSLFAGYAVTDAMEVRVSGLYSAHLIAATDKDPQMLFQVLNLALIFRYSLDLSPVRPTLEAGIGVLHQRLDGQAATSASLLVGLGGDWAVLPWLEIGAVFHYHAFLQAPGTLPVYFDVGPRVTFRL